MQNNTYDITGHFYSHANFIVTSSTGLCLYFSLFPCNHYESFKTHFQAFFHKSFCKDLFKMLYFFLSFLQTLPNDFYVVALN